ncbi:MAG: winged helix-turn-helix transcriptional regulator [Clostridia bacterium]|nr:MAG: winged helix-turn-helix transcriptional regulator [Clostridia bacterium]
MELQSQYQVLTYLSHGADTSQRKIAAGTGLSPGMVNILLQRMVKKGLVKLERVNGKTLRYILTPLGMAEKTRLAYQYVQHSYQQIQRVSQALAVVVNEFGPPAAGVVFFGPPDDIVEVLKMVAHYQGISYRMAHRPEELPAGGNSGSLIVTWQDEAKQTLTVTGHQVVNILRYI